MIIYLDGENVVHQLMEVLRRTGHLQTRDDMLKVNLVRLIQELVGTSDFKVKYYTTTLKLVKTDEDLEKRSSDMIAWTALWTNHLTEQGIEVIKAGKLAARDGIVCKNCGHQEVVFREKGVDVRLAVDLVRLRNRQDSSRLEFRWRSPTSNTRREGARGESKKSNSQRFAQLGTGQTMRGMANLY